MTSVYYRLEIIDIAAHLIAVTLRFTPELPVHQLQLPAWIPGSYMIRDFARNILAITAHDADGELALTHTDKQSWQLSCNNKPVEVCYQIYANDLSVRAAYIDDEVAILNPACLCLAVDTLQHQPQQLEVCQPVNCTDWRVATGLGAQPGTEFLGFGHFQATDYQQLIDSPLLLGRFSLSCFQINDVPHYLVISGRNRTDESRFVADVEKICQQQVQVFGSLPPDLTQYWFLLWVTDEGYGGLEHLNSTLLLCSRKDLPLPGNATVDDNYQNLLALCSHEYFHTWWVKRLKPANYQKYQLASEQYSRQLWLYEGFTSYFDDLALVQSGLISQDDYRRVLEKLISRVTRNPSDRAQSLTDSSFTAWTKFYKQDENAVNAVVSYYAKGALLALCLEGALRAQGASLAQICRTLYQRYLQSGTDDNALQQVLTEAGFSELAALSQQWLNSPQPLPLESYLPALGLSLSLRPMQHADDLGGTSDNSAGVFIGALSKTVGSQLQLSHVYHGEAAHAAGLMTGDVLLALDDIKISSANFNGLLQRYMPGTTAKLHFFRKDRLLCCDIRLDSANTQVAILSISDEQLYQNWLTGNAGAALTAE